MRAIVVSTGARVEGEENQAPRAQSKKTAGDKTSSYRRLLKKTHDGGLRVSANLGANTPRSNRRLRPPRTAERKIECFIGL